MISQRNLLCLTQILDSMKHVLITGVSSGIGHSITKYLLEKGFFVFGSVRSKNDAEKLKSQFSANFEPLIFDLLDKDAIVKSKFLVEKILKSAKLDAIINNAGISIHGPLKYLPIEDIQLQFDTNVIGTLMVTLTYLDLLKSNPSNSTNRGTIINMSSISGVFTTPFLTPYCSSKYALESISDGLRRELIPLGINVVSIRPGPVNTEIWNKAVQDERNYKGTVYEPYFSKKEKVIESIKLKAVKVEEISKIVHKVLLKRSPKSNYVVMRFSIYYWLQRYMPGRVIDEIYRMAFGRF